MAKYDVVIIGSGLGGLLCGYILSKEGYKVCIMEQGRQIGGCLQTFTRDGRVFDTGVHYVGGLDRGQNLWQYFKYFGLIDKLKIQRMDENGFDRIVFGNNSNEYRYAMGRERFINTLLVHFPKEKDALNAYCDKLGEICSKFPLYNVKPEEGNLPETDYFTHNAFEFIKSITSNPMLCHVLAGTNPLYSGVAEKTPLYVHALIVDSFMQSAWRLVNGSSQIADSLVESIKHHGGTILAGSKVVRLTVAGNKVQSAETGNSDIVQGDYFISDIHPRTTMEMLTGGNIRKTYKERIMRLENTCSAFIVYLCLKKDRFDYMNHNYYYYAEENVWTGQRYDETNWPRGCFFTTPATSNSQKYADSMIALAYMNYEDVKEWENTTTGKRDSNYIDFKQRKAEQLISFIARKYPHIRDSIQSYYSSTPLTLRDYTGTVEGSLYGISRNSNDPMATTILPKTKIPNLFLTGQNTVLHGVLGVTIAAVSTCAQLVGSKYLVNKIKKA